MKAFAGALLLLALAACGGLAPAPPPLSLAAATKLAIAADDAVAAAYQDGETAALRQLFVATAAAPIVERVHALARAGDHLERRPDVRQVVHWRASSGFVEVVLKSLGSERLLRGGAPAAWSRYVRQWLVELAFDGSRWLVSKAGDLPPERWWR